MKPKNFIVASLAISSLFIACEKDADIIKDNEGVANFELSPKEAAERLMQRCRAKADKLSKQDFGVLAAATELRMNDIQKNPSISSGSEPVEDIFYLHEGLMNNQLGHAFDGHDVLRIVEKSVEFTYFEDTQGNYYISQPELNSLYSEIQLEAEAEVALNSDEEILLVDLTLDEMGARPWIAEMTLKIAISKPQFYTAGAGVFASDKQGYCGNPSIEFVDMADFLKAYANNWANNNFPANSSYVVIWQNWINYWPMGPSPSDVVYYQNNVYPNYWHNNQNVCLGNTNQEWQELYADMDVLINRALSFGNSLGYAQPLYFISTDYHSHSPTTSPSADFMGNTHYHGGRFLLGYVY